MDFGAVKRSTARRQLPAHALSVQSTRSILNVTPAMYRRAVAAADGGRLADAADFCSAMLRDGRIGGVMDQRTAGMLALPSRFDPADAADPAALAAWTEAFPEAEQARLLLWGQFLGAGFARPETDLLADGWQRTIRTWDPRWFDQDVDGQWWVTTAQGRRKVCAGDGWIVYLPFGEHEPTRFGLWHRLAVPYLAKTYAIDDRARSGEITPMLVAETTGLSDAQRRTFLSDLAGLANDSRVVLPEGCKLGVVDRAGGQQTLIHEQTIAWSDVEITVAATGQRVTTDGAPGFSAGGAQKAILHSILRQQEATFSTTLGAQGLTPWLQLVAGYRGPTICPRWDVSDPETLTAKAYAITQLAPQLAAMDQALAASGARVDVRALLEVAGVPLVDLPAAGVAAAPAAAPGGAPAAPGAPATPEAPGTPTGPVAGAPGATDAGAEPLGADAAADVPTPQTDAAREQFAQRMNAAAADRCRHNRVNACAICGVERVATVERDPATGELSYPIEWRALPLSATSTIAASSGRGRGRVRLLTSVHALDAASAEQLPDTFLIFAHGVNATDKGDVIVDEEGIAETLAAIGNRRLMIDLEHLSLDPRSPHYDPDARGSFLVRESAEGLEAYDVRWTEDGARRVLSRTQFYTSPAVRVSADGRMVGLINVGLVAQPATQQIAPLIAASSTTRGTPMDDETLLLLLRTLCGLKPEATNDEIAAKITEKFTGNKPEADKPAKPADAGAPPPADGAAPPMTAVAASATAPAVASSDPVAVALRAAFKVGTDAEALAALQGAQSSVVQVAALSATVGALEADRVARERAEILSAHAKKFSPALVQWAQTQTPAQLRAFAANAPDLTSEHLAPPKGPAAVVLTDDDHAVARSLGISTADLAAHRAAKGV